MADIVPIVTFKAGKCNGETDSLPAKIKCDPEPGYIYLYAEEDFGHFCWRPRSNDVGNPDNIDLFMLPGDAQFVPFTGRDNQRTDDGPVKSPINGRIFVLKFSSSSQRYFFWLQSPPHNPNKPNQFSSRDLKIGELVDAFLQGADIDAEAIRDASSAPTGDEDEDEESGGGSRLFRSESTGGAGADATGGDIREEGEEAREGGADGARATTTNASTLVQNLINSLQQQQAGSSPSARQVQQADTFTTLPDLLSSNTTIPLLSSFPEPLIDSLLSSLPAPILLLAHHQSDVGEEVEEEVTLNSTLDSDEKMGLLMSLTIDQKRQVLAKVLRSPQLHQSLGSLTVALRDGGLPMVASSLGVNVANEGYVRGSAMPLGGGQAVQAFVDGIKKQADKEKGENDDDDDEMDVE